MLAQYLFSRHPPAGPRPLAGTPAVFAPDLLVTAGLNAELFVSRLAPEAHFTVVADAVFSAALLARAGLAAGDLVVRTPSDKARTVSSVRDVRNHDGSLVACLDGRVTRPDAISGFRKLTTGGEMRVASLETARSLIVDADGTTISPDDTLMLGQWNQQNGLVTERRLYDVLEVGEAREGIRVVLDRMCI